MTTALTDGLPQAPAGAAEREPLETLGFFSDLQPPDWAYQALMELQQHYGCVAGVPGGAFAGQRSIAASIWLLSVLATIDPGLPGDLVAAQVSSIVRRVTLNRRKRCDPRGAPGICFLRPFLLINF